MPPIRAEDVPLRTIVLVSAADQNELKPMLRAFESTGLADILCVDILTEEEAGSDQPEYWQAKFAGIECFIILMTHRLVTSRAHAALVGPYFEMNWDRDKEAVPVRIEEFDSGLSPITRHVQALPRGGLAVADWPIPDNAWLDIALSIRQRRIFPFRERLHTFTRERLVDEVRSKAKSDFEYETAHEFIDVPSHILRLKFPYRRYGFDFRVSPFLRWNALAILIFAASCISAHTSVLTAQIVVVPALTLSLVFGYLAANRQLARMRCDPYWRLENYELSRIFGGFFRPNSDERWAKRTIWLSAAGVGLTCVAASAAIAALIVKSPAVSGWLTVHPLLAGVALGLVVGSLVYMANCRRMPKVLMERADLTNRSHSLRWHKGAFEVQLPRMDYSRKDDGVIGTLPSHEEELIRGYSESIRVSLLDLARAALESTFLAAGIVGLMWGAHILTNGALKYTLLGFIIVAITGPATIFMPGFGLAVLKERLYRSYRRYDAEPRWDYWQRMFREGIMAAPRWRSFVAYFVTVFMLYAIGGVTNLAEAMAAVFPIAIWAFIFFSRCSQLITHSAAAHRRRG
jgi:hypothetical protein